MIGRGGFAKDFELLALSLSSLHSVIYEVKKVAEIMMMCGGGGGGEGDGATCSMGHREKRAQAPDMVERSH